MYRNPTNKRTLERKYKIKKVQPSWKKKNGKRQMKSQCVYEDRIEKSGKQ